MMKLRKPLPAFQPFTGRPEVLSPAEVACCEAFHETRRREERYVRCWLKQRTVSIIAILFLLICASPEAATAPPVEWELKNEGFLDTSGACATQTPDGGFIAVGRTTSQTTSLDYVYLVKTDRAGTIQWTNVFRSVQDDVGYFIQPTGDGGYIITGYTRVPLQLSSKRLLLIKTNAFGSVMWSSEFAQPGEEALTVTHK